MHGDAKTQRNKVRKLQIDWLIIINYNDDVLLFVKRKSKGCTGKWRKELDNMPAFCLQ